LDIVGFFGAVVNHAAFDHFGFSLSGVGGSVLMRED